jgi:adenylate cyclase
LRALPGGWIPIASIGMACAYLALATTAFNHANLWLPLVTPLLVQGSLATFGALLLRYRDVHRERENIRRAFGMHLPISVVDQLAQGIDSFNASSERAFGVCLATDAEQYTMLAERLEPAALRQLMNAYYEAVFAPVKRHGGIVTDVVGDSMLAIWAGGTDTPELRIKACRAALELLTVVHEFNERSPQHRLPVRAGVHCGELVLGHVGAADHYEYRAVGDIVNTASRIEGLSKQLGTRLLASEEVVTGLPGLYTRALGSFILKGKTRPVAIHELMSAGDVDQTRALQQAFAEALHAFTAGEWAEAQERFSTIQRAHGNDGPSAFYGKLCRRYLAAPPRKDWNGVVTLTSK